MCHVRNSCYCTELRTVMYENFFYEVIIFKRVCMAQWPSRLESKSVDNYALSVQFALTKYSKPLK